jgi:hypothetical protein
MLQKKLYYDNGLVLFNDEWMTREDANKKLMNLKEVRAQNASEAEVESAPAAEGTPKEPETGDDDNGGGIWD